MPLTAAHRCQICGDVLFHDDFFSDPSQHFCLTVNGPGMIDPRANVCNIIKYSTSEITNNVVPKPKTRAREAPRRADSECLSGCESDANCEAS
ncbi:hypothetical protein MBLNU13_g03394t1 [Cladosporium sp. NU13]